MAQVHIPPPSPLSLAPLLPCSLAPLLPCSLAPLLPFFACVVCKQKKLTSESKQDKKTTHKARRTSDTASTSPAGKFVGKITQFLVQSSSAEAKKSEHALRPDERAFVVVQKVQMECVHVHVCVCACACVCWGLEKEIMLIGHVYCLRMVSCRLFSRLPVPVLSHHPVSAQYPLEHFPRNRDTSKEYIPITDLGCLEVRPLLTAHACLLLCCCVAVLLCCCVCV